MRPRTPAPPHPGFVYFLQETFSGAIKIGWHAHGGSYRRASIQEHHPYLIRVLGEFRGTRLEERMVQNIFAAQQIRGEWYRPSTELHQVAAGNTELLHRLARPYLDGTARIRRLPARPPQDPNILAA